MPNRRSTEHVSLRQICPRSWGALRVPPEPYYFPATEHKIWASATFNSIVHFETWLGIKIYAGCNCWTRDLLCVDVAAEPQHRRWSGVTLLGVELGAVRRDNDHLITRIVCGEAASNTDLYRDVQQRSRGCYIFWYCCLYCCLKSTRMEIWLARRRLHYE